MQEGPRILVAAALGKIIEPILRQSLTDAKVRIAEDKDAVLRAIGDRLRFDVAVTDLTWMDYAVEYSFDGLDVLNALRLAGRQTPVIFAAQGHGLERDQLDEAVEQAEQLFEIGEMQSGCWFVEDVDTALLTHLRREFEPLTLATRQAPRPARQQRADVDSREIRVRKCVDKIRNMRYMYSTDRNVCAWRRPSEEKRSDGCFKRW